MKKLKRKTPFLDYLEKSVEEKGMDHIGLCTAESFGGIPFIPNILMPTELDRVIIATEGGSYNYWGITDLLTETYYDITPMRQTILCFAALLTGEYE